MKNHNRWYNGTWQSGYDISPHQTEFATKMRIPFLADPYPSEYYLFGIVVTTNDVWGWHGEIPTNEEVEVIADVRNAYIEYFFPRPSAFRDEMEAYAPYDIDGAHPGCYFIKRPDGSWAYRRTDWTSGPEFVPDLRDAPMTLAEVIDLADLHYERLPRLSNR